jgi:hypothetical protein
MVQFSTIDKPADHQIFRRLYRKVHCNYQSGRKYHDEKEEGEYKRVCELIL